MSISPLPPDLERDPDDERSSIEFRFDDPGYAATVVLCADHDLATSEGVRVALAPLCGNVLVDLTRCSFIDSTVIGMLIGKARDLRRDGYALELRVSSDPASQVARTLALVGIDTVMPVHLEAPSAQEG
jgi:anti-anti-sigma factor